MLSAHQVRWAYIWCALACLVGAQPASAQIGATAFPIQELNFGVLQPGLSEAISPDDAQRRAAFGFEGIGNFNLVFTLPTHLYSASGAAMPVSFGPTDGYVGLGAPLDPLTGETFDPNQPKTVLIPAALGLAEIRLGGVAQPEPAQRPGDYSSTITLQISPIL